MADYKATAAQLASIANAIRMKGGTRAVLEYPSEWIDAIGNLTPASGGSEITPADPTAEYKVTDTELTAIADAIRERGGTSALLEFPAEFVSAIGNISGGVDIVPWSTGTDEQIVAMIQAAHNGDIDLQEDGGWRIGDIRNVTVGAHTIVRYNNSAFQVVQTTRQVAITSFDDYMNCGCVLQFDFINGPLGGINTGNNANGGYLNSGVRTVSLPNMYNALPSWLKNNMIEFSCIGTDAPADTTPVTINGNKLALRSMVEICGQRYWGSCDEGSWLDYYKNSNNSIKKSMSGSASKWWCRTPSGPFSGDWTYVNTTGNGKNCSMASGNESVIAPFGCL